MYNVSSGIVWVRFLNVLLQGHRSPYASAYSLSNHTEQLWHPGVMLRFLKLGSLYIFDEDKNKEVCKRFDISLITYRLLQASLINNTILSIRKCQNSYQNTHPDSVRRKQSPLVDGKLVKLWMGIVQKWSLLLLFNSANQKQAFC